MNFQKVRGGLDWGKSLPLIKHIRVLDGARIGSSEMATSYCTKIVLDFLLGLHAKPEPRPVRRSVRCAPVVRVGDRGTARFHMALAGFAVGRTKAILLRNVPCGVD